MCKHDRLEEAVLDIQTNFIVPKKNLEMLERWKEFKRQNIYFNNTTENSTEIGADIIHFKMNFNVETIKDSDFTMYNRPERS